MKILVTEPEFFPKDQIKSLEALGNIISKKLSREDLMEEIKDADVVMVRTGTIIDKDIIGVAEKLKMIVSITTGLDHIDVDAAKSKNIEVVNFPGYATDSASEYTMALILSLVRKVPWAFENLKNDIWERHLFLGNGLKGKTLGVVGFGRIGSAVGKYAASFGMKVIFFDPYVKEETLKESDTTQVQSLEDILERSDIITFHTFLSEETESMIGKDQFSKMKKNAFVINISRGPVIDEDALVDALSSNVISGAAIDVFQHEPLQSSSRLLKYAKTHENLILTPHIAGSTAESVEAAVKKSVERIIGDFSN